MHGAGGDSNDPAEQFKKELEKFLPKFNKSKPQASTSFSAGIVAWVIILLLGCVGTWVAGAMIAFGVFGYRVVLHLLGYSQ